MSVTCDSQAVLDQRYDGGGSGLLTSPCRCSGARDAPATPLPVPVPVLTLPLPPSDGAGGAYSGASTGDVPASDASHDWRYAGGSLPDTERWSAGTGPPSSCRSPASLASECELSQGPAFSPPWGLVYPRGSSANSSDSACPPPYPESTGTSASAGCGAAERVARTALLH